MIIHNITIRNFKSLYGEHYFDFDKCKGLIKLSGQIGTGKTSLAESIIWGLFGTVKGQTNTNIISWNEKTCEIEMNLTSKNKEIYIKRNVKEPLIIKVNNTLLAASNKKDTQQILEEELLDLPKLAIVKMCIISFSQFNSLANMNPAETKQFLDEVFGFKIFTDYNNIIINEQKILKNSLVALDAIQKETESQINNIKNKKATQTKELQENINVDKINEERNELNKQKNILNEEKQKLLLDKTNNIKEIDKEIKEYKEKLIKVSTLGKQARENYNLFKNGICPTCKQKIDEGTITEYKNLIDTYVNIYRENEVILNDKTNKKNEIVSLFDTKILNCSNKISEIDNNIYNLQNKINLYNNSINIIETNYDKIIEEQNQKLEEIDTKIKDTMKNISEWNEMEILFSKTLRYNLIEKIIPHINNSIQEFIYKLNQPFIVKYDQEFKIHIFIETYNREISYNNLSTGQKKTLDLAIIFGILQNIISSIDLNIIFLDELFSNMDADTRNVMLSLINETFYNKNKSIFIVNHAEMSDDYFSHKIRVKIVNKEIIYKKGKEEVKTIIKCSKYSQEF